MIDGQLAGRARSPLRASPVLGNLLAISWLYPLTLGQERCYSPRKNTATALPVMAEPTQPSTEATAGQFVATHWSAVVRAGGLDSQAATEALEALCRIYWYPLYVFARRHGCNPSDAEDLTQSFFARLVERNFVARADSSKGRFRTFLLTLFKRFLANEWHREHAQKRGGFGRAVAIDADLAESRLGAVQAHGGQPDVLFERQWAVTLLDQVMSRLQAEYVASGRGQLFEHLEACLIRDAVALPYAEIAAKLKLTEAAVKMAMQRLRARYQAILREEIGKTVASPEDVDSELKHLFDAFRT
jgi:RNA polymerase sigma factor (sigma-70 family)